MSHPDPLYDPADRELTLDVNESVNDRINTTIVHDPDMDEGCQCEDCLEFYSRSYRSRMNGNQEGE